MVDRDATIVHRGATVVHRDAAISGPDATISIWTRPSQSGRNHLRAEHDHIGRRRDHHNCAPDWKSGHANIIDQNAIISGWDATTILSDANTIAGDPSLIAETMLKRASPPP
jgi:hypothetical protein